MAVRHFCDRCDREVDKPSHLHAITVQDEHADSSRKVADMCKWCRNALLDFLRPLPKAAEAQGASRSQRLNDHCNP